MPARPPNGRNVKSGTPRAVNNTAEGHERAKDSLNGEIAALLDAAKGGRHGARDHLLLLVMFPPRPSGQRGRRFPARRG
jgi:hypothetical protein